MSRVRGVRLQLALARYLSAWWPSAESAGAGRQGTDILGTPGIVWECKTAARFLPEEFCRQARKHASLPCVDGQDLVEDAAVVVYFPVGIGERSMGTAIAMMPLADMVHLLISAGYSTGAANVKDS